jgi:hypothetical protein
MFGALLQYFEGAFKVFEKIGNVTYKLELLDHLRAHHLVFHTIQLNPCNIDEGDPSIVSPSRSLALIANKTEMEVEEILAHWTYYFGIN